MARKLGRNDRRVLETMRELREERIDIEIPIFEDSGVEIDAELKYLRGEGPDPFDRPTMPEPIPACRIHVEKPVANYTVPALDCGKELERILIVPDTHAPFHDSRAFMALLSFARDWRPHTIVCLGDFSDFFSVSDHDKDPRRGTNLLEEVKIAKSLLGSFDYECAPQRKIFCAGNHEYRLDRYLMRQAPALLGAVTLDGLFNFQENGWLYIPYMHQGRIGNLHITHDVGKSGANAVQQTAVAVGHNIVFGHTHRLQSSYFGTVLGERYVSASLGWLGDFAAADYVNDVTKAQWTHGFGTALMERNGDFELQLRPIINGRVISQ